MHVHGNPKASFASREEIRQASDDRETKVEVHYDGMGGARTNHHV